MQKSMSALPPKADMCGALAHVCFVSLADINDMSGAAATAGVRGVALRVDDHSTGSWLCNAKSTAVPTAYVKFKWRPKRRRI